MTERCELSIDRIARLLDGDLPDRERRDLEEHLEGCPLCRAELALQREIRKALAKQRPDASLTAGFTESVMARLEPLPVRRPRRIRAALLRGVAAAVLLAASLAPRLAGGVGGSGGLSGQGAAASSFLAGAAAPIEWTAGASAGILSRIAPIAPVPLLALLLVGVAGVWGTRSCLAFLRD